MGGAQQLVYEIAKRMQKSNREVVIFTGLSDSKKSLSALDNKIFKEVSKEKIPVEVIPSLNDRISLIADLKSLFKIYKLLKIYKPSIVHIHGSKAGILGRLACKLSNFNKVIFHVHGWPFSGSIRFFSSKLYLWLEKLFYILTTKYIFVSKQDILDFVNLGVNQKIIAKSHVIYPGANYFEPDKQKKFRTDLRNELGFRDSDFVVGTVSRLDFQKNPEIFIEIADKYAKINSDAKFLWIGKGSYEKKINNKIEELRLSDKFVLPGYIEYVEPYFSVFDIFIITSRHEGLPITALKALACGIPVVGFNVNGINDLSEKFSSVYGVKPYDIWEFVKQLTNSKNMIETRNKIIEKDAKYVRDHFNLDKMYDKIVKIYDSI